MARSLGRGYSLFAVQRQDGSTGFIPARTWREAVGTDVALQQYRSVQLRMQHQAGARFNAAEIDAFNRRLLQQRAPTARSTFTDEEIRAFEQRLRRRR